MVDSNNNILNQIQFEPETQNIQEDASKASFNNPIATNWDLDDSRDGYNIYDDKTINLNVPEPKDTEDKEIEKEEVVDTTDVNNKEQEPSNSFKDLIDAGLLLIPEDIDLSTITEDKLFELKSKRELELQTRAIDAIYEQLPNETSKTLFEAAIKGFDLNDLLVVKENLDTVEYYKNLDISDKDIAKDLIIKMELDKNSMSNATEEIKKYIIKGIEDKIKSFEDNYTLDEEALTAKDYFLQKEKEKLEAFEANKAKELEEQKQKEIALEAERKEMERKYNEWSHKLKLEVTQNKNKDILLKLLDDVTYFTDKGQAYKQPLWKTKADEMIANPKTFIVFLNFLERFDETSKTFKDGTLVPSNSGVRDENSKVSNLIEKLKNIGSDQKDIKSNKSNKSSKGGSILDIL